MRMSDDPVEARAPPRAPPRATPRATRDPEATTTYVWVPGSDVNGADNSTYIMYIMYKRGQRLAPLDRTSWLAEASRCVAGGHTEG